MRYFDRIRAARDEVRAVEADMASEDDRHTTPWQPRPEDARFAELTDRAEHADARFRAALLGRDLPAETDNPTAAAHTAAGQDPLRQAEDAVRHLERRTQAAEQHPPERGGQPAQWHAAEHDSGHDAGLSRED